MEHMEHSGTPPRNTKNRSWCFTWNNYTENDIRYLVENLAESRYLFGEEVGGNTGTPHLQGVVNFKSARSFNSVKKLFKDNHIEICRNWKASLNYCSKDGQTYTNIERQRTRKERLLMRYEDVEWYEWQSEIIDIVNTVPNDRTINWYYEDEGNTGKSFLAKYLVLKYDAIIADGKKDNVFNQIKTWLDMHKDHEDPRLIIIDLPRHNLEYLNYGMLEQIKNGMIYSGKYEGGTCLFESPHIFVFANREPIESKLSLDRWNIVNISSRI